MALIFDEIQGKVLKIGRDDDNHIDFSTDNTINFRVNANSELKLDAFQLYPSTNDGLKLGHASYQWSDLFLASGAVINFNNGDVTLTHSGNNLAISGGNLEFTGYGAQFADNAKIQLGASNDLQIYHDGTDNHIDATSALNLATGTSGVQVNIGHTTSEVVVNDNLTVTGDLTIVGDTIMQSTTNTTISDTIIRLNAGVSSGTANTHDTGLMFNRGSSDRVFFGWDESVDKFIMVTTSTAADAAAGNVAIANNEAYQTLVANIQAPLTATVGGNNVMTVAGGTMSGAIAMSNNNISGVANLSINAGNLSITGDGSHAVTLTQSGNGDFTIDAPDDIRLDAGGGDVVLKTGGTEYGRISSYSNNLRLTSSATNADIILQPNGTGNVDINSDIVMGNNDITGVRFIQANGNVDIRTGSGEYAIHASQDGQTSLYHNGIKKFETTSVGIDVVGEVQGDSLDIDGNADISGTLNMGGTVTMVDGNVITGSNDVKIYARSTDTGASFIQFQNLSTGSSNSDGLTVGVNGTTAYVWQRENTNLLLGTNDTTAVTINSSQEVTVEGGTLTLASDGSSGYTNSRVILKSTQNNARGAGVFMHNENDDQEFYMGVPYSQSFDRFMIAHKSTASHTDSTAHFDNVLFDIDTSGTATFTGNLRVPSRIEHDGDTNTWIGFDDGNDTFRVVTNGSEKLHVNNTRTRISNNNLEVNGDLDLNGNADISGTTNLGVTNFDGLLTWTGTDYADAINLSEGDLNNANEINAYEFKQRATGEPRSNLGIPTVTEMALFEQQFKPQTTLANDYDDLSDIAFYKQDNNGDSWDTVTVIDAQKKKFLRTNNSNVVIPNGTYKYRVEFVARSYTFANALYGYTSTNSHNMQVHIWKRRCSDNTWIQHTSSTSTISSWPGHLYLPFSTIPWHETNTTSTGHFNMIRIEYTPNWIPYSGSGTDYSGNNISLYGMQMWGGYPTGRRTPHSYNEDGEMSLPDSLSLKDGKYIRLGTGDDLKIYHDGSNSYIENEVGNLTIFNKANDSDLIFSSDNGSGGTETYFFLDGSISSGNPFTVFPDNSHLAFGNSQDLQIDHDGNHSVIYNKTGHLYISNDSNDGDIVLRSDDGSGGVTAYLTLDGGLGYTTAHKNIRFDDSQSLILGAGSDFLAYHNGTNTYLLNDTGNLEIQQRVDDGDIVFKCDDGSGGVAEYLRLDGSAAITVVSREMRFTDNVKAKFGTGPDLEIYHDGSHSYINGQSGAGSLYIRPGAGGTVQIEDNSGNDMIVGAGSGAVSLYYAASKKFETTSSGIDVTGNATASKASDTRIESKATTAGAYFRANSAANNYFGLELYHDTTAKWFLGNYIDHASLSSNEFAIISGAKSNGNVRLKIDSSGNTTFFGDTYLNSSGNYIYSDISDNSFKFADDATLKIGTGNDLQLLHDGNNSHIVNYGGDLKITQNANDKDIIFNCDNGAGGNTEYFKLDGSLATHDGSATTAMYTVWPDDSIIALGTSRDLVMYHTGTSSFISNYTGHFYIDQNLDDGDIVFRCDDGSGGTAEYFRLDGGVGYMIASKAIRALDSVNLQLGASADLTLQHNGTDSQITNYTGNLQFTNVADNKDISFASDNGAGGDTIYFFLDGSKATHNGSATTSLYTVFPDLSRLAFGNDSDLNIRHDGTDSAIENTNGDLYIQNQADDKDIVFTCDDGSGGSTAYLRLDGSDPSLVVSKKMLLGDNVSFYVGSNIDLQLNHDGSDTYITARNTDLKIQQLGDDKDIKFLCDDGSGGVTEYFRLDGGNAQTEFERNVKFLDTVELRLGTSNDLKMVHNGTNTEIENLTGNLNIKQQQDNGNINFYGDNGSGGVTTYFQIDGGSEILQVHKDLYALDGIKLRVGDAGDLYMLHDGSNSYIHHNGTGNLYMKADTGNIQIINYTNDADIVLQSDNGSGGVTPYLTLDGSETKINVSCANGMQFDDNVRIKVGSGTGGDLRIYHDGSNSYINEAGTGDLVLNTNGASIKLLFNDSEFMGQFVANGSARLYYDNNKKFETVSAGVKTAYGKTSSTDGDAAGDIVYFGSTTGMEVGKIYYLNSSGNWALTDADAEATAKGMLAVALGSASDTDGMLIRGFVTLDHDPGSVGHTLFLHTTAGQATITAPSGNGDIVRVIGYMLDSTNGQIYFNPDGTFVEVTA